MINFNFTITNPFNHRFNIILSKHGKFTKNKAWEINAYKNNVIIGFNFRWTARGDHAGVTLEAGILGYEFEIKVYDCRHWDYKFNKWEG